MMSNFSHGSSTEEMGSPKKDPRELVKVELNVDDSSSYNAGVTIKEEPYDPSYDEVQVLPCKSQQDLPLSPLSSIICANDVKQEWGQDTASEGAKACEIQIKSEPDDLTEETEVEFRTETEVSKLNDLEIEEECDDTKAAFLPETALNEQTPKQELSATKEKHKYSEGCKQCEYVCTECGENFTNKHQLANHMKVHYRTWPFICKLCNVVFKYKGLLQRHKMTRHSESFYKCLHCQKLFDKEDELNHHIYNVSASPKEPHKCPKCGKTAKCKTYLWAHVLTHKRETPSYICKHCGMAFKTKEAVTKHMLYKHAIGGHTCEVCGGLFESQLRLVNHLLTHQGASEQKKCLQCNGTFERKEDLFEHLLSHTDKAFACKVCLKSFDTKEDLNTHSCDLQYCNLCLKTFSSKEELREHRSLHNVGEGHKVCVECGKTFKFKVSYLKHMRSCHGDGPFPCERCSEVCEKQTELMLHLQTKHSCRELYFCEECNLEFCSWSEIITHRQSHEFKCTKTYTKPANACHNECSDLDDEDEKTLMHKCHCCRMTFESKDILLKHIEMCCKDCSMESATDLAEQQTTLVYNCDRCLMKFKSKVTLLKHMKVCLNEPCQCTECSFELNSWTDMLVHRRDCHVYKCHKCSKTFNSRSEFKEHVGVEDGMYNCLTCGMGFKMISKMMRHSLEAHNNIKPFKCKKCGKTFRKKVCLTQHLTKHCIMRNKSSLVPDMGHGVNYQDSEGLYNIAKKNIKQYSRKTSRLPQIIQTVPSCTREAEDGCETEHPIRQKQNADGPNTEHTIMSDDGDDVSCKRRKIMQYRRKDNCLPDSMNPTIKQEPVNDNRNESLITQKQSTINGGALDNEDSIAKNVRQYGRKANSTNLVSTTVKEEPETNTRNLVVEQCSIDVDDRPMASLSNYAWNDGNKSKAKENIRQYGRSANRNLANTELKEEPECNIGMGNLVTQLASRGEGDEAFVNTEPEVNAANETLVIRRWNKRVGLAAAMSTSSWNDENSIARKNLRQYGRKANKLANSADKKESVGSAGSESSKTEHGVMKMEPSKTESQHCSQEAVVPHSAVFVQNANNIVNLLPDNKMALKVVLKKKQDDDDAVKDGVAKQFLVIIQRRETSTSSVAGLGENSVDTTEETETEIIVPD